MKFTFKTNKPTGKYKSFYLPYHDIKLNKVKVGSIEHKPPHTINLMVIKQDINEDKNPNCVWKRVRLERYFKSLDEAKEWLNQNIKQLTEKYNFVKEQSCNQNTKNKKDSYSK